MGAETSAAGTGVRFGRALLYLTLLGFAARVLFLLLWPYQCAPAGDEPGWLAMGLHELGRPNRGLSPMRVRILFWPPLYGYFIAILNRLFHSVRAVLWAQVVLATLLVPAVGRVGRMAIGPRVGLVAAAFTALYPELLWYPVHYWSETLYLVLMWWAIERTVAAEAARSWPSAFAAGTLFGLSSLTRELSLYLVPIAAIWLCASLLVARIREGRGDEGRRDVGRVVWLPAAALVLGTVLVVAPWTVRNAIVYHAFVPVSTMGGPPLWQSNAVPSLTHERINELIGTRGPVEAYRYCRQMAWAAIVARQPYWIFEKLVEQMPEFWKAGSEVLDHLVGRTACGELSSRSISRLEIAFVGPWLVLLGTALPALARLKLSGGRLFLLALLAVYNALHVVAFGSPRYRLGIVPIVFLLAAATIVGGRDGALHRASPKRWLVLAFLLALTLAVLYPGMQELTTWQRIVGSR